MDKGAHFYRCDFQVHSPRDTSWVGQRPSCEEERMVYAERFIKACREKGLGAVAITDHHDLVFFRYIKAAAQNEVDDLGVENHRTAEGKWPEAYLWRTFEGCLAEFSDKDRFLLLGF